MTHRHLSWENLKHSIDSGTPFRFPIEGTPRLEFSIEAGSTSLALLIPAPDESAPSPNMPIEALSAENITFDGRRCLRIFTQVRPLYREFYSLMCEIADSVQLDGLSAEDAIATRLDNWRELLRGSAILSIEAQTGLMGELWALLRLIRSRGTGAVHGWTGPTAEPHDFRLGQIELEVKSTRSRQRTHQIHGLDQLQASPGLSLYILSLVFEPANTDDSFSLPSLIEAIRENLKGEVDPLRRFNQLLSDGAGYSATYEAHYQSRFRMRMRPEIVAIEENFPRLTRQKLSLVVGSAVQNRIGDVSYSVNLEGLGEPEESQIFDTVFGSDSI